MQCCRNSRSIQLREEPYSFTQYLNSQCHKWSEKKKKQKTYTKIYWKFPHFTIVVRFFFKILCNLCTSECSIFHTISFWFFRTEFSEFPDFFRFFQGTGLNVLTSNLPRRNKQNKKKILMNSITSSAQHLCSSHCSPCNIEPKD